MEKTSEEKNFNNLKKYIETHIPLIEETKE